MIDSVLPESSSINARVVSHLDVSQNDELEIVQRIVYDAEDRWRAPDLKLLQMAAPLIPFAMVRPSLDRVVAQ